MICFQSDDVCPDTGNTPFTQQRSKSNGTHLRIFENAFAIKIVPVHHFQEHLGQLKRHKT